MRVHLDVASCIVCGSKRVDDVLRMRLTEKARPDLPDLVKLGVCESEDCRHRLICFVMMGPPKVATC